MTWYGFPLTDVKVRIPKSLPTYIEDSDIEKLLSAVDKKRSHKDIIVRDRLLIKTAWRTGARREELADLKPRDIHGTFLILRDAKYNKDRTIPLVPSLAEELTAFIAGMEPDQPVFGLTAGTISNKIHKIAERAGVPHIHTHSLRHKFATDLLERGVNVRVVQELMGHENLNTTQVYLSITEPQLYEAVNRLEEPSPSELSSAPVAKMVEQGLLDDSQPGKYRYYEETHHEQKIRKVARILAESIPLPSVMDRELWKVLPFEFKPGKYYLPIGMTEIDKNGRIKVRYYETGSGIGEPYLIKGLFSHLSTSDMPKFTELTGNKGKINNLQVKTGRSSKKLLLFLKLILDVFAGSGTTLLIDDNQKPGLTKWFVVTVWVDAIQQAGGHTWISSSWYHPPERISGTKLWQLKCGGDSIGIASNKKTLKNLETWHKDLRTNYAGNPLAKAINTTSQEISNLAQEIRQVLLEFSDMKRLPGHCELC